MDLPEALTERELEILSLLAKGLSNREIAARLHLSYKTVKWYNTQIYSKLGVRNRDTAIQQGQTLGLLTTNNATDPHHNLPYQTTPFIGRQQELVDLAHLIADPNTRLLTILAPGGMGKTRLSIEAAHSQMGHYTNGIYFVPLAPLRSADQIVSAIAGTLGFNFSGGDPPQRQLLSFLQTQHILLVLDNFEHLLDGAGLVTDIIQTAPHCKVLATSREKLNLTGETVFALSGMHVPDWETPDDALTYDAVQLFVQSAQRVRPNFRLHPEALDHLVPICRLTAGLPLALVLAAGWIDVLTLEQIAKEIQQGIDILETELRDVPARHRSIHATFERSWIRLDESERDVFMKLSVFRGGFTAEAAQAVAGANPRHLRKLVDKALVQYLAAGRYDILELLRQYAEEKLIAVGDLAASEAAHTHYFADFVQQRAADIKGRRQRDGLNDFGADFQNVRTAWQRAISAKQYPALDAMMEGLWLGCHMRERLQDSEVLFETALNALEAANDDIAQPTLSRLRLWWIRVVKNTFRHDPDEIRNQLKLCKAIAQQHGDSIALAHCLVLQGFYGTVGPEIDWEAVVKQIQEAIALYRSQGEDLHVMLGLSMIVTLHRELDGAPDDPMIVDVMEQWLSLARATGNKIAAAFGLYMAALYADADGRYAESVVRMRESREIWMELGHSQGLIQSLIPQAFMALFQGHFEEALDLAEQLILMGPRKNMRRLVNDARAIQGFVAVVQGKYEAGSKLANMAVSSAAQGRGFNHTAWRTLTLATFCLGDREQARRHAKTGLQGLIENYNTRDAAQWLPIAALLLAEEGNEECAAELVALFSSHPDSITGWLEQWPLWSQFRQDLEDGLSTADYGAAWDRGSQLDLRTVVEALPVAFAGWLS